MSTSDTTGERVQSYVPRMDDPLLSQMDPEDDEPRRGPFVLIAAAGFLVLFGAVLWNFYSQGVREGGRSAPPQITADASPYKTIPADPGGAMTPDTDKAVFESAQAAAPPGVQVETVDASDAPLIAQAQAATPSEPVDLRPAPATPATAPKPAPPAAMRPRIEEKAVEPAPPPRAAVRIEPAPAPAQQAARTPPPAAPARPAPSQQAAATPAQRPAPAATGGVSAQLGAFGSEATARDAWNRYRAAAPAAFSGQSPSISTVERDGKTFYRLRTGGFASRADAQAFCSRASAAGAQCIVAGS
jgi:outer membrane biosynthesis protein TonB